MQKSLKCLSLLLAYPSTEIQNEIEALGAALEADGQLSGAALDALAPLMALYADADIWDLQESYVELFDRSRTLSLNLFEHLHGESRDRGGAMVDLLETYRSGGFDLETSELPDHLPVLLEYLSTRPVGEVRELLVDASHILGALHTRLTRRTSPYAGVFAALLSIAGVALDEATSPELVAEPDDDPNDLEALDAVWEEAEVTFGPDPNAGCPQVRDMLANMDTPPAAARSQLTGAGNA